MMNDLIAEKEIAEKIHAAALKLLDDPGIRLDHDEICKLFLKSGAKEGRSANVIRLPEELIREKFALLPEEFVFANREGKGKANGATSEAVIWSVPGMKMCRKQYGSPIFFEGYGESCTTASPAGECGWGIWICNG